jgi:hypothetical protein
MPLLDDRFNGIQASVAVKAPVRVATTANITLSGEQTIVGVAVSENGSGVAPDRVLVKDQANTVENGIYDVSTSGWSRSKDFDGARDVQQGTLVPVYAGTVNGRTIWQCTTANPVRPGTSGLTFEIITDVDLAADLANRTNSALGTNLVGHYDPILPAYLKYTSDILNGLSVSADIALTAAQIADRRGYGFGYDLTDRVADLLDAADSVEFQYGGYRIDGEITLRSGVKIFGKSRHASLQPTSGLVNILGGTIIHLSNTSDSPFIYRSGNHFEGLTFYHPDQLRTDSSPNVYPSVFAPNTENMSEVLVNNSFHKLQFVNAYSWIDAKRGHLDFEFCDLVGAPVHRGIETDGCGGTDIFRNIRGSYYYWCQAGDAAAVWMLANARGISVGRSDAFHMDRIYFGNLNVGIRFFRGSVNTTTGPYGSITGLSLDGNNYGVYSESNHGIGVNIAEMMSNNLIMDIEIASGGPDSSNIQVSGFKFWGAKTNGVRMNRASSLKLANGQIYSATNAGVSVGVASCDLSMDSVSFHDMPGVPPLATSAQCNQLMLSNNGFHMAPTLNAPAATIARYRGNTYLADADIGVPTQASGTGTINNGSTTAVITHGLNKTPAIGEISITGGENPTNDIGAIFVNTITSTQFTVNVENDPGASGFDFGWHVS